MTKCCDLTGVGAQTGNKVSHSNRKAKRRFEPNIQKVTLHSDALKNNLSLNVTVATLRSIDHNGGLDSFILSTASSKLTTYGRALKKRINDRVEKKAAS
jgi:large subunit ribosomal protein L28